MNTKLIDTFRLQRIEIVGKIIRLGRLRCQAITYIKKSSWKPLVEFRLTLSIWLIILVILGINCKI